MDPNMGVPQPTIRPLRLLKFPDEILMKISGHVRGWTPDEKYFPNDTPTGITNIKNLRMTCRRLCSTSSHLLMHSIDAEVNIASLSQLDRISRHQGIRKGIREVRVLLHYYDSVIADSFHVFVRHFIKEFGQEVGRIGRLPSQNNIHRSTTRSTPWNTLLDQVGQAKGILAVCRGVLNGVSADQNNQEDMRIRTIPRKAHGEYQHRYAEQHALIEKGTFVLAIAAAIARMPVARRLEIRDDDGPQWFNRLRSMDSLDYSNESLTQRLLLPHRWEDAVSHQLGVPPAQLVLRLPIAIHTAGVLLTHLNIWTTPLKNYDSLAVSQEELCALKPSVQRLKEFSFVCREERYFPEIRPDSRDVNALKQYLLSILDTSSVKHIRLDLDFTWDAETRPTYSLGTICTFRTWPKLACCFLGGLPLNQSDLQRFADRVPATAQIVSLSSPFLLEGSWSEVLEALRATTTKYWRIENPWGAECESMSQENMKLIFGTSNGDRKSLANQFVQGTMDQNPFVRLRRQDS